MAMTIANSAFAMAALVMVLSLLISSFVRGILLD